LQPVEGNTDVAICATISEDDKQIDQTVIGGYKGRKKSSQNNDDMNKKDKEKDSDYSTTTTGQNPNTDIDMSRESINVDIATICLYYGTVVKNILAMCISHKPVQSRVMLHNVYLLQALRINNVIEQTADAFSFVVAAIVDRLRDAREVQKETGNPVLYIGSDIKCALHALPRFLALFLKCADVENYGRSESNSVLDTMLQAPTSLLPGEKRFEIYQLVYSTFMPIARRLVGVL